MEIQRDGTRCHFLQNSLFTRQQARRETDYTSETAHNLGIKLFVLAALKES
jgi:hypothetical protein